MGGSDNYAWNVFINCPFDGRYRPLFRAIVFTVYDCGFIPYCALDVDDAAVDRLSKILSIVQRCKFGIHDLSRTGLDHKTRLPRFNMPLELGIFLAARRYGQGRNRQKMTLILDKDDQRYRKFISDLAGREVKAHQNTPQGAVKVIRDFLKTSPSGKTWSIPGGEVIWERYQEFLKDLPAICREAQVSPKSLTYVDFQQAVEGWLEVRA